LKQQAEARKMKRFSVLIVLFVLLASTLGLSGCLVGLSCGGVSDKDLINKMSDPQYPGYSDIKVLKRAGEGTGISPRVLTLQVTMESYPDSVVCEGELVYFHSDPSYREMRWYTLEGIGHWLLVEEARYQLKYDGYPYWPEPVALVLKRWIEKGFINIDDITNPGMRRQIDYFMDPADVPTHFNNAGLFDTTSMQTYDLAPELPDSEKTPVYILRYDNGIVELYLVAKGTWHEKTTELRQKGMLLPTPIPKPEEGQE
jgi:hypothetical protein